MKKLFALFLVVAMLSVAGTAMATVTVSPDKVSVAAGSTATVVVTVAPGDGYVVVGTPTASVSWVTFTSSSDSGYTFTAAPTASVGAGDYTVTFTATESLDVTGHSAVVVTETGTATITVTNAAPTPIPYNPPTTGRTVEKVKVISVTVATIATRVQTFTTVVVTRVTTLFNTASTKTAVATALSNLLGGAVPVSATVQNPDNTRTYLSSNYTAGDNAGNLEKAAAKLKQASGNDNKRAIGVIEPFTVEAAGFQPMALAVDKTFAGQKIGMNMGAYRLTSTSSVSAAATAGGNEVVFFTSDGASTDVVPDSGDLTAIAYVEPGVAYEPIPYVDLTGVSAADIASLDNAAGTTSKDVTVADESTSGIDAGILDLLSRDLIALDATGTYWLTPLAFKNGKAPEQEQSGTVYTWVIGLNFPVKNGGWRLHADDTLIDSSEFEASASGIAATTSTDATATIDVLDLSVGKHTVTLGVIPASSDSDTEVFYTLGSVTRRSEDVGVGSSSGGCASMGSVLAVAVLGAFIAARKK